MIDVKNISFKYAGQQALVFDDFSLQLEQNRIYGLLGKNGTGKSTLLYLIAGLLRPAAGTVCCDGTATCLRRPELLSDLFLVPEEFELPAMSLAKYVGLNAPFYPRYSQEVLERCLADFELTPDVQLGALSMGQKKKVFMSFALATNTGLLIMDEPTNGLDIPGKSQFRKFIAQGMTDDKIILISTHQVRDIDSILDHVVIIDNSRVLLNASVGEVSRRLAFRPVQPGEQPLYVQQSVMGTLGVMPGNGEEETSVDMEMLFNATLQQPERVNELFNQEK